jgi:plasmid stabilization system protein ParE
MAAVENAVNQVVEFPKAAPFVWGEVRGKVVSRFPYTLMYRVDDEVVVILAVAHQKQRPEYWVDRLR